MAATAISTAKLREAANKLAETASGMNTQITKLYETGQQLDNMWDGDASASFMNTFRNDQENFKKLVQILNSCSATLKTNADTYARSEQDAKDAVTKGLARG